MKEENDLRVGGWVIIKDAAGVVLKGVIEIMWVVIPYDFDG